VSVQHWPWYFGGVALTAVAAGHWLLLKRMMAVSGRVTAIVNRIRFGPEKPPTLSRAELEAALLAATLAEFGEQVPKPAAPPPSRPREPQPLSLTKPQGMGIHALFFGGLLVGGVVSAVLAGGVELSPSLRGADFEGFFGGAGRYAVLLLGGLCVGFGTRMTGGCTSGHGLCGVSRFQPASLIATAAFFGTGVATSFALSFLLR